MRRLVTLRGETPKASVFPVSQWTDILLPWG
jgi:hypothetical protein